MSHISLNNSLWIAGLLLQFSLLILIFTRRMAQSLRMFTVALAFYPLRSAIPPLIQGHMDRNAYGNLFDALSLVDIGLQLIVAAEIGVHLLRAQPAQTRVRVLLGAVLPVAWLGTVVIVGYLPIYAPAPPDRFQIFSSLVMLLLCVCTVVLRAPSLLRNVALGYAVYGVAFILTYSMQTTAALRLKPHAYQLWGYVPGVVYLLIVVFWILVLKPGEPQAKFAPPQPALS